MRFGGNTAYVEGWALYAETLGYDMGFYKDPNARFGTLNDEMLRAMRLVVDTGIHTKGWTREQSIAYMLAHSGMSKTDATAEVERYIAIPEPGARLQDRRAHHPAAAQEGGSRTGRQVRHPRVPCRSADDRRAADGDARGEDRPLDCGEEGELIVIPGSTRDPPFLPTWDPRLRVGLISL